MHRNENIKQAFTKNIHIKKVSDTVVTKKDEIYRNQCRQCHVCKSINQSTNRNIDWHVECKVTLFCPSVTGHILYASSQRHFQLTQTLLWAVNSRLITTTHSCVSSSHACHYICGYFSVANFYDVTWIRACCSSLLPTLSSGHSLAAAAKNSPADQKAFFP